MYKIILYTDVCIVVNQFENSGSLKIAVYTVQISLYIGLLLQQTPFLCSQTQIESISKWLLIYSIMHETNVFLNNCILRHHG